MQIHVKMNHKRRIMNSFTIHRSWDPPFPPLPFQPNGAGVNCFVQGCKEDLEPEDCVELCWVNRGRCIIEVQKTQFELQRGQCIFRIPMERRRKYVTEGPAEIWWATIDGENAKTFIDMFHYPVGVLNSGECPVELFQRITKGLLKNRPDMPRLLVPLYTDLFVRAGNAGSKCSFLHPVAEEALFRLNTEYSDSDLNINALAECLEIHRTTLDRIMLKEFNETPINMLTRIRLDNGLFLLQTTSLPIAEIAKQCGFKESGYFCRLIHRKIKMSPLEYRKSFQRNQ